MTDQITLVVTSCGRFSLLQQTMRSFLKFNAYPIMEGIIIEDSGRLDLRASLDIEFPFPATIIQNETNLGQIMSVDIAYSQVKTPYIFHCEDDWEFFKPGFIEPSLDILRRDPRVLTVGCEPTTTRWATRSTSCRTVDTITWRSISIASGMASHS